MTDTKKEVINELYDATLLTTGVVGVSYLAKTVAGKSLGAQQGGISFSTNQRFVYIFALSQSECVKRFIT
jgi:hypothetical protein